MKLLFVILALMAIVVVMILTFIAPNVSNEIIFLCMAVFFLCCSHFAKS